MKSKKLLMLVALLLALIMTPCVLAGCSGSGDDTDGFASTTEDSVAESSSDGQESNSQDNTDGAGDENNKKPSQGENNNGDGSNPSQDENNKDEGQKPTDSADIDNINNGWTSGWN